MTRYDLPENADDFSRLLHYARNSQRKKDLSGVSGQAYGKTLQLYGFHKATIEARKKGLSLMRKQRQNGSIKLLLMGVS